MLRRRGDRPESTGELFPVPGASGYGGLWPSFPPDRHLGQLEAGFQEKMAAARAGVTRDDCFFYHSVDLPEGQVPGAWDLRGQEDEYLGHVPVAGRRVLEVGPATGHLTSWLEAEGAEVVCFDVGWDACIDLLPVPGRDPIADREQAMRGEGIVAVQNSWWYVRRARGLSARMVYGDIYALPGDLGRFGVSVFGSVLLHLAEPFRALAEAAARTDDALVVVDLVQAGLEDEDRGLMRFDPLENPDHRTVWWALSPGAVLAMVRRLGFGETQVFRHKQSHHLGHRLDEPATMMEMFTVVARRA